MLKTLLTILENEKTDWKRTLRCQSLKSISVERDIFNRKALAPAFTALLLLLFIAGNAGGVTYNVTHSKIDDTADSHGTTRTTVRHVFRCDGLWYVFCGDHRGKTYYSFFVTSPDGVNWSGRKAGNGGGVTSGLYGSPDYYESPLVIDNRVYSTWQDSSTNHLMIRCGTIAEGTITWSPVSIVVQGNRSPRESYGYYPDLMIEADGRF